MGLVIVVRFWKRGSVLFMYSFVRIVLGVVAVLLRFWEVKGGGGYRVVLRFK